MTAHIPGCVTSSTMLVQISVALGCISAVIAATSHTSVSNLHGGSYTYGINHDNYGAWYGTAHPFANGLVGSTHGSLYSLASPHDTTYGSNFGYGDHGYATSYQNYNQKSYGGHKVVHAGHGIHHHNGATSYANFKLNTGHSLYGGEHGTYAGGYGHATSQANFNLKSYRLHEPIPFVVHNYDFGYGHGLDHDAVSYVDLSHFEHGYDHHNFGIPAPIDHADLYNFGHYGYGQNFHGLAYY